MEQHPAHYQLRIVEDPSVERFLLSNGISIDVESYAGHSGMREELLSWARKEFGDKSISIVGTTVLVRGALHGTTTVSVWVPPTEEPAPKKSSGTSTKRSKPTTRRARVRPAD